MQVRRKIAVAGAAGRVGCHVVDLLKTGGHEVVAMSRSSGVDVVTGSGLVEAMADPNRDVFETGGLLPGPHVTLAGPTFEEWLDSTF